MTAKFEAFKAALEALCIEHGVHLRSGDDYDDYSCLYAEEAHEGCPAGVEIDITHMPAPQPLTPEELAAKEARQADERAQREAYEARCRAQWALAKTQEAERLAALAQCGDYLNLQAAIEAHAKEQRKQLMRVSTDPNDPAYIDARPRKAWVNDILIEGWTVADEFRRCVITPEKVHNGAVLIERLTDAEVEPEVPAVEVPIDSMTGMFEYVPDAKPAPVAAPAAEPVAAPEPTKKAGKSR
jgi:hypothetical protein